MNSINYNHLFNFFVVAKSGSIKTAAISLKVTSSTLSEQISNLEKQLGEELFTRVGRSLSLNPRGRFIFQKIEPFFSETETYLSPSSFKTKSSPIGVEIGITTTISKVFAYEIFSQLFKEKGMHMRITESTADTLLMDFKTQNIDIFITHEKLSNALVKKLNSVTIREPELIVVGGKEYKDKFPKFPQEVSGSPFFLFTVRTPLRWEIEKFFKSKNIVPDIRAEVDDPEILKAAVLDNMGLAVLPDHSIRKELAEKKLFSLGSLPKSGIQIYAYYMESGSNKELEKALKILKNSHS